MDQVFATTAQHIPWNKGRLVGQKLPLRLKEIWAIRIRLQLAKRARELALFNLAIDSKLRGCDLVSLRVSERPRAAESPAGGASSVVTLFSMILERTLDKKRQAPACLRLPQCGPITLSSLPRTPRERACAASSARR